MDIRKPEELRPGLDEHLARFDDCIKTRPSREHLRTYVNGQLGPLARKSVEPIALEADVPVRSLQEFLEIHRRDEAKLARRVREIVMDRHADPEVEHLFHEAKGEVGMRHFEVRHHKPVMRHLVLSMVSLLFLCEEVKRLRGKDRWPKVRLLMPCGLP
jgi:SRSO17 transposase